MTPTEYERAQAIVSVSTITMSISFSYPDFSETERDAMIVGIIDRMARMRGWAIRRERTVEEVDGE